MFSQKKKFFVLSIALLCISCLIFTGCGNNKNNNTTNPPANNNQTDTPTEDADNNILPGDEDNAEDNNTDNATDKNTNSADGDLHDRAEKIADAVVKDVAQVKDARTVISEKLAYVSVEIDNTADTAESATLKDEITEVVKKTDTEIETVYVMEDADTFTRMKEIGDDIANGKPVSGFAEELENLFVRVTPTPKS